MEDLQALLIGKFDTYIQSFVALTEEQQKNFTIRKEHSLRVADMIFHLAEKLNLAEDEKCLAFSIGLFHDLGRFKQIKEYNTFNDLESIDHAECSAEIMEKGGFIESFEENRANIAITAIRNHNKRILPKGLAKESLFFSKLIRDADKLDILKVITAHYSNPRVAPAHSLTWQLPKSNVVSPKVLKQILDGELVAKENIASELDLKVMQLSWIYDINFKPSVEILIQNRFLEEIYDSMPKNDTVIEIYRKVKVDAQNKLTTAQ